MSISDFFKPRYKNSNPKIRLEEVRSMTGENQDVLGEIALKDEDKEVRRTAIKKLKATEILKQVASGESDAELKKIAVNTLASELIGELKKEAPSLTLEECSEYLTEERYIEDLARNSKNSQVKLDALAKIQKEATRERIALTDADEQVALAAFEGVQREGALKEIMAHAKVPAVRTKASAIYKAIQEEKEAEALKDLEARKVGVVLSTLKRVVEGNAIEKESEYQSLVQEWGALKGASAEQQAEFTSLQNGFTEKLNAAKQAEEAKAKEAEIQKANAETSQAIVAKLEEIVNQHLGEESVAAVEAVKAEWSALDFAVDASIKAQFEKTLDRFEAQLKLSSEEKQTINEEKEQRLEILNQLKGLAESVDLSSVQKQLQGLSKAWDSFSTASLSDDLHKNYENLKGGIHTKMDEAKKKIEEELENTKSRLGDIIDQVGKIDENDDFRVISRELRNLHQKWRETVGDKKKQFQDLWNDFKQATSRFEEMQQWQHWYNERDRDSIIADLEKAVAETEGGADLYKKIRQCQTEWRQMGPVSSNKYEELNDRFGTACETGFQKCEPWLETQKAEREENLAEKSKLCEQVEAVNSQEKSSWKEAAQQVRELQTQWREIGPVPREDSDEIWKRFKGQCDAFYDEHRKFLKVEEGNREENLAKKTALCEQAEQVAEKKRWKEGTQKLKELQDEWKKVGAVPKAVSDEIWKRFRKACDSFFDAKREYYQAIDKEKSANLEAKQALCEKLESLSPEGELEALNGTIEELQDEWKKVGPVPKDQSDAIWERFCTAADVIYRKHYDENKDLQKKVKANLDEKQKIITRAQAVTSSDNLGQAGRDLKELQDDWKNLGRIGNFDQELWKEFRDICDEFFERRRDQFEIMNQVRTNNLEKKVLLCEQAEKAVSMEDVHEARKEVKHLRKLWKEIGPVPRKDSDAIWDRFQTACNSAFQNPEEETEAAS